MRRIWLNHWFSTAYNIIRLIRDSEDKPRAMLFRDWMRSQPRPGETPPDFEEDEASSAPREIPPRR